MLEIKIYGVFDVCVLMDCQIYLIECFIFYRWCISRKHITFKQPFMHIKDSQNDDQIHEKVAHS